MWAAFIEIGLFVLLFGWVAWAVYAKPRQPGKKNNPK
jgi:hypothetical protein